MLVYCFSRTSSRERPRERPPPEGRLISTHFRFEPARRTNALLVRVCGEFASPNKLPPTRKLPPESSGADATRSLAPSSSSVQRNHSINCSPLPGPAPVSPASLPTRQDCKQYRANGAPAGPIEVAAGCAKLARFNSASGRLISLEPREPERAGHPKRTMQLPIPAIESIWRRLMLLLLSSWSS